MASVQQRSRVLDVVGLVAGLAVVAGPALAWLRVVPALAGFYAFLLGGIVSVIVGLTALVSAARGRGFGFGRTLAILMAMVFVFTASAPGGMPMINDFTTDLDDPPAFRHAATLPANAGRDLAYPADFAAQQRECCADLRAARLAAAPPAAMERAEAVAATMPMWTITRVDREQSTIEAIAESRVFGFQDDVVIRIRPEGSGSVVDVRSKSRDGRGDMGANAARIREYVAALESKAP
jgi:uncharacterized protein (DUF1499 family)